MLEKVLGPGQAVVRVSAEINWDTVTRTEEKFDPDGQVGAPAPRSMMKTPTPPLPPQPAAPPDQPPTAVRGRSNTNAAPPLPVNSSQTHKKVTNNQLRDQ